MQLYALYLEYILKIYKWKRYTNHQQGSVIKFWLFLWIHKHLRKGVNQISRTINVIDKPIWHATSPLSQCDQVPHFLVQLIPLLPVELRNSWLSQWAEILPLGQITQWRRHNEGFCSRKSFAIVTNIGDSNLISCW